MNESCLICVNDACPKYERVMSYIWMRHVTHMNESGRKYVNVAFPTNE